MTGHIFEKRELLKFFPFFVNKLYALKSKLTRNKKDHSIDLLNFFD